MQYYNVKHSPRLVAHGLQVKAFGFIPGRTDMVDRPFEVVGFSFITRGSGRYMRNSQEWSVKAPCVLVQLPGSRYRYGPLKEWDEFFVTYLGGCLGSFAGKSWLKLNSPVIPLPDDKKLVFFRNEILSLCDDISATGRVDRIDQLFEQLILEVIISSRTPAVETIEDKVLSIKRLIERQLKEPLSIKSIARDFAFSERSLLRYWRQMFGGAPGKYLMEVRIRKACELLATTEMPVGDIARETGFQDEFYFSRRFHVEEGDSPRNYRRKNKI